jgi:N-acetylglucosamine-6-phosphate deacetylase
VIGLHIEGPYISPEDGPRGAHPRADVRPPDREEFERWQRLSGGRIRILTLSPEWPGVNEFITEVTASGVVVAIGHTAATPEQIAAAAAAGARMSTHLGNGSHAKN